MKNSTSHPPLAVTIGDTAGIGPEVALRALSQPDMPRCVLIGPPAAAVRARDLVAPGVEITVVEAPEEALNLRSETWMVTRTVRNTSFASIMATRPPASRTPLCCSSISV